MIHVKRINGRAHYEIRVFKPDQQYGDVYDVSLNAVVHDEFIEITMMNGTLSRPVFQIKELARKLDGLRVYYGLPILAQRKNGILPFAQHLCGDWWEMK